MVDGTRGTGEILQPYVFTEQFHAVSRLHLRRCERAYVKRDQIHGYPAHHPHLGSGNEGDTAVAERPGIAVRVAPRLTLLAVCPTARHALPRNRQFAVSRSSLFAEP